MAEIITIPDLENGKVDIDTLADIVNLQEPTTETRLSGPVNTWFGVQSQLSSATGLVYATKPEMDAAPGTVIGQAARVTEGSDSGLYVWSGSSWVETSDPLLNFDTLTANRDKDYPLLSATRDGIVSPAGTTNTRYWPNVLLGIEVYGPEDLVIDKYFRILRFYNGNSSRYGLQLAEYPQSTYATASVETIIEAGDVDYGLRAGTGIQVITIIPESRPTLRVKIAVDTDQLPPDGTPLNANVSGIPCWSWVIHPDCVYPLIPSQVDALTLNNNSVFPFRSAARDGTVSAENTAFTESIADVVVYGTKPGKIYRVEYFVNGDEPTNQYKPWAWILAEYDAATYGTDSASSRRLLQNFTHDGPEFPLTGIQTIEIACVNDPSIIFKITINTDKLPPWGTSIRSATGSYAGYSWILDPKSYAPASITTPTPGATGGNLAVTVSSGSIQAAFASTSDCYKWSFGPIGFNNLPNFQPISRADGTDLDSATFSVVTPFTTDFIGPLIFQKAGVAFRNSVFTGGNHLVDTYQTAQNIVNRILVDGVQVTEFNGRARRVDVQIVHRVMAANTVVAPGSVTDASYVALQKIWVRFFESGAVFVEGEVMALQDAVFQRDYALQAVASGFIDTVMIAGGQQGERIPWTTDLLSGPQSEYPDASVFVTRSADNGQLACWFDRDFGADVRVIDPSESLIRGSTTKMYQLAVWDRVSGLPLAAGESYKWRGGYYLSSDRADASETIDSLVDKGDGYIAVSINGNHV